MLFLTFTLRIAHDFFNIATSFSSKVHIGGVKTLSPIFIEQFPIIYFSFSTFHSAELSHPVQL